MTPQVPLSRDVVLVGGGHAHALVLRRWAMRPMPGARLTLINPGPTAPYTGMLPGFVAGHYDLDDIEIDLFRLCRAAGARLILGAVTGLDRTTKTLTVPGRPPVPYDLASIDIGVHSTLEDLPGFRQHAVPAKPLARLAKRWSEHLESRTSGDVAILGGGVAGVELAMSVAHRLKQEGLSGTVRILEKDRLLAASDRGLKQRLEKALRRNGIEVLEDAEVATIEAGHVRLSDESTVPAALTIGATGARPWAWLKETDLPLENGFIRVDANLGVQGDDALFAVGDCAHLAHAPRPKAGVFAVRAAPVLDANIEADLRGTPRHRFQPQRDFLKLISLGRKSAVAHRSGWHGEGDWAWRLKDRIDRKFMHRLEHVPTMATVHGKTHPIKASADLEDMPCAACGGKVGAAALTPALNSATGAIRDDVEVPQGDDAAIIHLGGERQVVTTDHIRAFDADPWRVAQIAALHALGDVLAMGAAPQAALAQITLPTLTPELQTRWVAEISAAAGTVFEEAGARLAGGHTATGAELFVGFTITGLLVDDPITLAGARPGDRLVLTRAIGSGTLLRGAMTGLTKGRDLAALYEVLETPQFGVAKALIGAHAMTDVTGFGLAGHASKMAQASGAQLTINLDAVPVFNGALALAEKGVRSSLYPENRKAVPNIDTGAAKAALLFDPQTAGGFLAAIGPDMPLPEGAFEIGSVTDGPVGVTLI